MQRTPRSVGKVCKAAESRLRPPDHSSTPMIAKIVSHTMNMHTIRPSVHPALRRLVTTNCLVGRIRRVIKGRTNERGDKVEEASCTSLDVHCYDNIAEGNVSW